MKIIEAMKIVKLNLSKINDLKIKIMSHCANLSYETPVYGEETPKIIQGWLQACNDITQENVKLLCGIQRTNLVTYVTIQIGEKSVTKTIAEWIWRRREYAGLDHAIWAALGDRGLKEGTIMTSTGNMESKLIRHYDPIERDKKILEFSNEKHAIDAALEIVNATTDLIGNDFPETNTIPKTSVLDEERLINTNEVADILQVSPVTVCNWRKIKKICEEMPFEYRVGRPVYKLSDVKAFKKIYQNGLKNIK